MTEPAEAIAPQNVIPNLEIIGDVRLDLSEAERSELLELNALNLPNLYESVLVGIQIRAGMINSMRPQQVRPPLSGRYASREGERVDRTELLPMVDEWLSTSQGKSRFVIQGGNRYISNYLDEIGIETGSMKIMSINKLPLYNQLITLLSPIERQEQCDPALVEAVAYALPESMHPQDETVNRSELLKLLAADTVVCPFRPVTKDENLETEFAEAVGLMDNVALPIINLDAIRKVLDGTELQRAFAKTDELHFLDDLFYRGRTLYSLAVVVEAFGGDPKSIRLTSLCCDMKSTNLTSPYHKVLNPSKLYTFENSIRTEQGYWQDVGDRYVFTDMADYWDLLHQQADGQESLTKYTEWQTKMHDWYEAHVERGATEVDMTLVGPLIWLRVYHDAFGLDMSIEKIVDQKGHRIGACVPFAQLIDRFVSQEETVEVRSAFKAEIIDILNRIQAASLIVPNDYRNLTEFYVQNQRNIDYNGLSFMFEVDTPPQLELSTYSPEYLTMIDLLKDRIAFEASNTERLYVVGINGVDTSGKTELTKALEASLRESGVKVSTVHFDTFTNPKSQRHSGLDAVDNYYNHTFDVDSLRHYILEPIAEGQLPKIELRHVDSRDDSILVEHAYDMPAAPSVVLVEGVFLFRPELQDYFGLKIFVDIPISAMRERTMIRDVPRFGFVALAKLMNKYIPAQEQYLHDVMPGNMSDIIIDNSNWSIPVITKHKE